MKALKGWRLFALMFGVVALIMLVVVQFAQMNPVFLSGEVLLPPALVAQAEGKRTVFIVLFADDGRPLPMPYAAAKFHLPEEPLGGTILRFTLNENNLQVMNPSRPRPQNVRVKARLDSTGVAGPDKEGDLVGEIPHVALGTTGLKISLR